MLDGNAVLCQFQLLVLREVAFHFCGSLADEGFVVLVFCDECRLGLFLSGFFPIRLVLTEYLQVLIIQLYCPALDTHGQEPAEGVAFACCPVESLGERLAEGLSNDEFLRLILVAVFIVKHDLQGDFFTRLVRKPFVEEGIAVVGRHHHLQVLQAGEARGGAFVVGAVDNQPAIHHLVGFAVVGFVCADDK